MVEPISAKLVVETKGISGMSSMQEPEHDGNIKRTNKLLRELIKLQGFILAENTGGLLKQLLAWFGIGAGAKAAGGGLGGASISGAAGAGASAALGGSLLGLGGIVGAAGFSGITTGNKPEQSLSEFVNEVEGAKKGANDIKTGLFNGFMNMIGFDSKTKRFVSAFDGATSALNKFEMDINNAPRPGRSRRAIMQQPGTQDVGEWEDNQSSDSSAPTYQPISMYGGSGGPTIVSAQIDNLLSNLGTPTDPTKKGY